MLLAEELMQCKFRGRFLDLYSFMQTTDLKTSTKPAISALRQLLYSREFTSLITDITGIELKDQVDMAGLRFSQTDHLLCHDDELEGRRIAYIVYLVPEDWSEEDGGTLDLFRVDAAGQPVEVAKRLVPAFNTFTFFEVSPVSFHQVAEVLAADKERLSISGWFYGAPFDRPAPPPDMPLVHLHNMLAPPMLDLPSAAAADFALLAHWINPQYLSRRLADKIARAFGSRSHIALPDFLREDRYEDVLRLLSTPQPWERVGPPHKRWYQRLPALDPAVFSETVGSGPKPKIPTPEGEVEGDVVTELRMLMQSRAFVNLIQRITNVDIAEVGGELRSFYSGSYTLLHDKTALDPARPAAPVLEACLCLSPVWEEEWGGSTTYTHDDVELLTAVPSSNTLQLVYQLPGASSFVKYVNRLATVPRLDVNFVYVCEETETDSSGDDATGQQRRGSDEVVHKRHQGQDAADQSDDGDSRGGADDSDSGYEDVSNDSDVPVANDGSDHGIEDEDDSDRMSDGPQPSK